MCRYVSMEMRPSQSCLGTGFSYPVPPVRALRVYAGERKAPTVHEYQPALPPSFNTP